MLGRAALFAMMTATVLSVRMVRGRQDARAMIGVPSLPLTPWPGRA
jgi:hypothetical protein